MQKNDAQMSGFTVVKKLILKKKKPNLFVQTRSSKWHAKVF